MGRNYSAQTLFSSSAKITTAASTERRGRVKTQQLNIRTVQCTQGEANSGLNPLTRTVLVGHAINAAPAQDGEYCDMRFGSQQRLNYEKNKRKGESRWLLKIKKWMNLQIWIVSSSGRVFSYFRKKSLFLDCIKKSGVNFLCQITSLDKSLMVRKLRHVGIWEYAKCASFNCWINSLGSKIVKRVPIFHAL